MAELTISEAAQACGVNRSTLQRAVQAGRLSLTQDHRVDTAELLRVGFTLHAVPPPQVCRRRPPHCSSALRQRWSATIACLRHLVPPQAPLVPPLQPQPRSAGPCASASWPCFRTIRRA